MPCSTAEADWRRVTRKTKILGKRRVVHETELQSRKPWVLLTGLFALAGLLIAWMGRGVSLIGDEWAWIFASVDPRFEDLFQNYNGHLMATTYALYDLLTRISLAHLWIYRAPALILHLVVAYLVFCLARRRLDSFTALVPTAVVLFLGTGADAYLSGLNYNELAATAACLGALLLLERQTPQADAAASGLLVLGIASFSNAVAFAAGVVVELLVRSDRSLRRLWIPLVPFALYAGWRLRWGSSSDAAPGSPTDVIRQAFRAATGAFAGLAGVQLENFTLKAHLPWLAAVAQIVLILLIVGTCTVFTMRHHRVSPRLANLVVTGAILWLLIGLGRSSQEVYASRYVYEGAIIALLILVELAAVFAVQTSTVRRILAFSIAVAIVLNIGWMAVWARHLRKASDLTRAQLAALEIAGSEAAPSFRPASGFLLDHVTAGDYFAAVREFGDSPAYSPGELRRAPEIQREAADRVLVRALALKLTAAGLRFTPADVQVEHLASGRLTHRGNCLLVSPRRDQAMAVDLVVRSSKGVTLMPTPRAALHIQVRRFADQYEPVPIPVHRTGRLLIPLGGAGDPWHLRVIANAPTTVC